MVEIDTRRRGLFSHGDDGAGPSALPSPRDDGWLFDVFLSFRGEDTRNGFTGHLYQALLGKGVNTFIDEQTLEKGEKVEELFTFIEKSRIFVPIFSKGYADSKWCLKEITKIVECGRSIFPVFFHVEPCEVRYQRGSFQSAFERHENNEGLKKEEVSKWRHALRKVGDISGFNLKDANWHEANLIKKIVNRVLKEVNPSCLDVALHPVGLDSRVDEVMELLKIGSSNDVQMVSICGMGGIGKTTLAKAVYNRLHSSFEACSFLANVREVSSHTNGVVTLQEQLLRDIFRDNKPRISNKDEGISQIRRRIGGKKVLIVIDDVDHKDRLDELAVSRDWFGGKSRIIITTRDEKVLSSRLPIIYKLAELDFAQSLQLFNWHAFGQPEPKPEYGELSEKVVSIAGGLPLCLKVFGSIFYDIEGFEEWNSMLEKLKRVQNKDIYERLRISYEGLDEETKCIFLDIACFFIGKDRKNAVFMWKGSNLSPIPAIRTLERKSLIRISEKTGEFEMHDQIRDMGRQIVRQQCSVPSRLWDNEETVNVLQGNQGTENIEAIFPHPSGERICLNTRHFKNMPKLRMLDISGARLEGPYHHFRESLKWLRWRRCPLKSLPIGFHLRNVVVLDLSNSEMEQVWDQHGRKWSSMMKNPMPFSPSRDANQVRSFDKLKVLDLGWCKNLRRTPDFRLTPNVAKLIFDGCTSLRQVDESIGHLWSLVCLNLRECHSLEQIPDTISRLGSLETLDLHGCSNISTLPENLGSLTSLKNLILDGTNLTALPESLTLVGNLKLLSLCRCRSLKQLPEQIGRLKSLTEFQVSQGEIPSIPESIGLLTNLQKLKIEGCKSLVALPASFISLKNLEELSIEGCRGIRDIPDFFAGLVKLRSLSMGGTDLLKALPPSFLHLCSLERWSFSCTAQQFEWAGRIDFSHLRSLTHVDFSPHFASYNYAWCGLCSALDTFPQLESLNLSRCCNIRSIPKLPPSLIYLNAECCEALETISDVSNLNILRKLNLNKCGNLLDVPGLEKLKCLEDLDLRECTSLCDALWNRMKEANFEGYVKLRLPGLPTCSSPTGPAVISFLVPPVPSVGSFSVRFERFWRGEYMTCARFTVSKDDFFIYDRRGIQWREMSLREMEWGELESNARIGHLVLREQKEVREISQMLADGNGCRQMHLTVEGAYKLRRCSIVLKR